MTRTQIEELVAEVEATRESGVDPNLCIIIAGVFIDAAPELLQLLERSEHHGSPAIREDARTAWLRMTAAG